MDIYVLNRNFETLDVMDDYQSVIWSTRYFSIGDFEIYCPATEKNILLLKEDRYVVRDKDIFTDGSDTIYKNVMVIERIRLTTSIEDGNYLTVTGRCLKSILSRRIVWQQTTLYGRLEVALRQIVNDNAINPAIGDRKINQLQLGALQGFTDTIDKQVTGDVVSTFIEEVCKTYEIGWDVYVKNDKMLFELYKGVDRSYNQNINPHVTFSNEFDNLLTSDYTYDKTNHKNVALVAGEGEGLNRKTAVVGNGTDLDRYELYVDSRNSSTNDGEISETEYKALLTEEGYENLSEPENSLIENIEGQIEVSSNYILNKDYFLGDVVEVINEYGIETTPRIIEIIDSDDDTGSTVIPTFSSLEV